MNAPMEWDDVPLVLTLEQVAELLQTGRTATYEAYRAGQIPAFRVGRKLRFSREAVRQIVDGTFRRANSSARVSAAVSAVDGRLSRGASR